MKNKTASKQKYAIFHLLLSLIMLVTILIPATTLTVSPVKAQTNTLSLQVVSAADNTQVIDQYRYLINIDNTGTTEQRSPADGCSTSDPGYPASCNWVSIAGTKSYSEIFTQGTQDDFASGGLNLPPGRYLISVMADNYKLDGAHFSVPLEDPGLVTVQLQPYPLPDATVRAWVFEDTVPTNSAPDAPAEHGLAGFVGHIRDYIDEVTTDVYGNPLCTRYEGEDPVTFEIPAASLDPDGVPIPIPGTGGQCISDDAGMLAIPHLGPNRYALSAVPPDGSGWIQTTTLEGNHDWDAWVMEGSTGYDTEFVVAGEPFPATFFGFVHESNTMGAGSGEIKGIAQAVSAYVPPTGGTTGELGLLGAKPKVPNPIKSFYVSLSDINNGDQTVYVGHFGSDDKFDITGVPDGDYFIGIWDEPQDFIFNEQNVSVRSGEVVDMGSVSMLGWWTTIEGHVFNDLDGNGKMDPGEPGIPNFFISMRKRENSTMDRGTATITTDGNGYYWMESAYPMTQWLVEEAYADGFQTTGVTYQADNQTEETTVLGQGVDVNVLPIIGLGGRLDWGVKAYAPGTNGGIVGTVSYDTTRNELNPAYAAIEDWQPSMPGLTVNLYAPVDCPLDGNGNPTTSCDENSFYQLDSDGSYSKGQLLNQYVTETWEQPAGCIARNVNGDPLMHGVDENVLPLAPDAICLEGPMMGLQFGPMSDGENFGASVNGNYGFGDGCFGPGGFDPVTGACADTTTVPTPLPSNRDYLVEVDIPNDALGKPMFKVTREEDINIANGDQFIPQVPPPACAGPLHTVDVAGFGTDNYAPVTLPNGVVVPASTPVDNPNFVDIGGSPYEGQAKPLCDTKLVHLSDRKSIAPGFNVFTDVPLPVRFWGLIVDDLNFSSNPQSLLYGEKMGLPFAPVGIYDYTNRLIYTAESDYNGLFDVLLPSTNRINCPTPSGVCANLYRFVGNDPGIPGRWNTNYSPQYRTIAAEFEAFPGLIVPADLAPTQVAVAVQIPGLQTLTPVVCTLDSITPQFFTISKPYMYTNSGLADRTFTIKGRSFGSAQGIVSLDSLKISASAWSDTQIVFTVPSGALSTGPHQLKITTAGGSSTINALTFHVISPGGGGGGGAYNPVVFEVGQGRAYSTIQSAIEAAAGVQKALVVVYPGLPDYSNPRYNGRGAYYENLIIHSPLKLQGVGPGGVYADGTPEQGAIIDGSAFGGDTTLADAWRTLISGLTWGGYQTVAEGQVIYLLANDGQFTSNYPAALDGLDIRGGDQMGFPGNLNAIFGGYPGPLEAGNVETQGGAIFANAYIRYLQVTNNIIESNGGSYGAIRFGTPNLPAPDTNQHNEFAKISNNRIIANGGTNLAGAIGLFAGSDSYEIANNDLCGNFSAEYGGAISHFGYSPNGKIHDNRIFFNRSYDEGAGIMIAGELPADPNLLSPGSGPVNIYNNLIQANLADDDGGGIRFLMAGNYPMNVYNNMIVNNVSTHEGGGVALDDAPNVRFYNNTVMKNITTATAITSDGTPAPAGLSTGQNSNQLQVTLPGGSPIFSNPLLFNNIFRDNRAGSRGIDTVTGIGADASPINYWDIGTFDGTGLPAPTNSILQDGSGITPSPTNIFADPLVVATIDIPLSFTSWRTNVNFIGAIMVTAGLPDSLLSNYHLSGTASPAYNTAASSKAVPSYQQPPSTLVPPAFDFDLEIRPSLGSYDIGADEILPAAAFKSLLDDFNRANTTSGLNAGAPAGVSWSQANANIRINSLQAFANSAGKAFWNGTLGGGPTFGTWQSASFTFVQSNGSPTAPLTGTSLLLKVTNGVGTITNPASYIQVQYQTTSGGRVLVQSTLNGNANNPTFTTIGILPSGLFATGDTLTAVANPDGSVEVWKTSAAGVTTYLGRTPTSTFTGSGRIGIQLPASARVDDFRGGTLP